LKGRKRSKEGGEKMTNQKLTAKKGLLIVVLTMASVVPACVLYFAIILLTYPFMGFYSAILSISIFVVPLLLAIAYTLKKRRTEK